jgi:hypothetical protein
VAVGVAVHRRRQQPPDDLILEPDEPCRLLSGQGTDGHRLIAAVNPAGEDPRAGEVDGNWLGRAAVPP